MERFIVQPQHVGFKDQKLSHVIDSDRAGRTFKKSANAKER